MIDFTNEGIILEKTDLEFEKQGVLNPGCIEVDGVVHMFYRAIGSDNVSTIGYCQLKNNHVVKRLEKPLLVPEHEYEKQGLEDPRIVALERKYYLFYTAYDGQNALTAYAVSDDLIQFHKQGLLSYKIAYAKTKEYFQNLRLSQRYLSFEHPYTITQGEGVLLWQKDTFLFPKKINGKYALIHRILPGIQIIFFDDWKHLNDKYWAIYFKTIGNYIILEPKYQFENYYIGGGSPPIETEDGWLLIYHAVEKVENGKIYHAAAALLDLTDPTKVIGRLPYPLFSPTEPWEVKGLNNVEGYVNSVVFPTGSIIDHGRLYVYYGASDEVIAAKSFILNDLLAELKNNQPKE